MLIAEQSVKSSLAYHFSKAYGESQSQYLSLNNYDVTSTNRKGVQKLIEILGWQLKHKSDYAYVNHYKAKYNNVPLWIMVQVLPMGTAFLITEPKIVLPIHGFTQNYTFL